MVRNGLGITIVSTPRGVLPMPKPAPERRRRSAGGGVPDEPYIGKADHRPLRRFGIQSPTVSHRRGPDAPLLTLSLREDHLRSKANFGSARQRYSKRARAFWGMQRTLVQNPDRCYRGLQEACSSLASAIVPTGRANLKLQLGYSHDVDFAGARRFENQDARQQFTAEISGIDRQKVGQVAEIRRWRKPEP